MAEQRMREMEKDRRLKKEVEMMNIEVENMRQMFLDTEIKRLAIREEAGEGVDEVREIIKDVFQKLELVDIQVEQQFGRLLQKAERHEGPVKVRGGGGSHEGGCGGHKQRYERGGLSSGWVWYNRRSVILLIAVTTRCSFWRRTWRPSSRR